MVQKSAGLTAATDGPTRRRRGRRGPRQDAQDTAVSLALGERVRQRRGLLGLSQQDLGRRVGLTFQQVQKYERGLNRISVPALVKIAAALDTTPAALLDGLGAGREPEPTDVGLLDREAMALLGASRQLPDIVRRAMLDLARTVVGSDLPTPVPGGTAGTASSPAGEKSRPERQRAVRLARPATDAANGTGKNRRRRGAVWDPADIYRAARPR